MRRPLGSLLAICVLVSALPAQGQDRRGFTALLSLGYGLQNGGTGDGTSEGIAGLNLGIGGFVSNDVALMFRISGTTVSPSYNGYNMDDVTFGVGVFDVQWWVSKRLNFEFGGGLGFSSRDNGSRGIGLLVCAGYSVLTKEKYSLQVGIENALYLDDYWDVNNLGFCVGFQFL